MKIIFAVIVFFMFSSLNYLTEFTHDINTLIDTDQFEQKLIDNESKSLNTLETVSSYKIDVNFDESERSINISGTQSWISKSDTILTEIFINVPSNNRENSKFRFNIDYDEMFDQMEYEFIPTQSKMFVDSSLVKLVLKDKLKFGDSLKINFNFSIIQNSKQKWGKSLFLQFENWYPQIAVFTSGKFKAYPQHRYVKTYSEFSNFNVNLNIPINYQIAAPGITEIGENNELRFYQCKIEKLTSFNWIIFNNYIESTYRLSNVPGNIDLKVFVHSGNENYAKRYSEAIERYLNALSKYFVLPYNSLTIIELPRNEKLLDKSYPTILAANSAIISPKGSQLLEYKIASLLSEQFFGNIVASDNLSESWISKGVSAFIAEKIVKKEYGELYSYFKIARYYPVRGLHYFSYSKIPLIYTIGDQIIPEGGRFIGEYYKNIIYSNISTASFNLPNYDAYRVASVVKPQLALLTFENYLGSEKLFTNLSSYFSQYRYQYATSSQFLDVIRNGCSKRSLNLTNDLFKTEKRFDYAIKYLSEISENNYELLVERREDGIAPITINVFTEKDTIKLFWDGVESFKRFKINSKNEVVSAQLDPKNENLLDINYANNSYVIETQYWGPLSFATRLFFWFQNALMIMG